MKQGIEMVYYAFSICMFCIALTLLVYFSHSIYQLECQVSETMYHQHVITCELA